MTENIRKTKGVPDIIDKHVGKQLKNRRILIGLSQEKLAEHIGVTFQQVQKYERGSNRISASRLYSFSKLLEVSIDYFYDGLPGISAQKAIYGMSDNKQQGFNSAPDHSKNIPEDLMTQKETIDLVRSYYSVDDEKKRKDILKMVKTMVKNMS